MTRALMVFILPFIMVIVPSDANYLRDPRICGNPKCQGSQKFEYVPRVKYKYSYTVDVHSVLESTGGRETANLTVSTELYIHFRTPCEGTLQITSASIGRVEDDSSAAYKEMFNEEMTKNPVRFSFEDGKIQEMCPEGKDQIWVYNFKKGILSSLQNSMKRFDVDTLLPETDVNGDCRTMYHFQKQNGTTLIILKKKMMKTCTNRYSFYSIIPTSNYIFQQKYHKWTPVNSSVECHQEVDHKILSGVFCKEDHSYQPFNNHTNGVKTLASSRLLLVGEEKEGPFETPHLINPGEVKNRDNLLFNHKRPKRATHDNLYECKRLLNRLCTFSMEDFQPEFPDVFNQFIHIARDLSTPAMLQLFKDSNYTCATGRKHMKDALPFIRSRASTYLMTEAILSREISESKIQEWLTIMSFFPRPDGETIDSVSTLIDQVEVEGQAMMSVAAMVHSYCENHPDCDVHPSVNKIISKLEDIFNNKHTFSNESQRLLAMKSIGNAGVMTESLLSTISKCILNKNETAELRVSCIQAHRRMSCEANRDLLINVLTNTTHSQEIRIASYIQLMRCPSYSTLQFVKQQLHDEEYNQVGSYIWSHLQNVMKSSMPNHMEIQAMLQDEVLSNKFDNDFRKFSRHYESSFFLNQFGIGGIVENSIIFSEQSYVPKTISTNMSVHMFGESIHILEATLRIEGVEHYIEQWYHKNKNLFQNEHLHSAFNMIRALRESSNSLNDMIRQIGYIHKYNSPLKVSLSLKTFGNEFKYYSIIGDSDFNALLDRLNPLKIIKDFLSGQEIEVERSTMLMDMSYTTPMSCGLPLRMNLVGTAAIHLTAMGFVNATTFTKDSNLEIDAKFNPSIGFHFEADIFVDAFVEEAGVKFKGTVFTSTAIEGSFNAKGYKHVTVSFNLPMKKSQIFHAESELVMLQERKVIPLDHLASGSVSNRICSWSILDETIGLKMCLNYQIPNGTVLLRSPSAIFSTPLQIGLTLEKSDPTANMYLFQYKMDTINNKTLITFKFETPGSETKRGMVAVIDLDTQSQNLTLTYQSTLSQVQAQGFYRNTPTEKLINFGLDINGKKHIDIHVGMEIEKEKYGFTYKPKLLFQINNKRIVSLSGSYRWVKKKGVSQCDIDLDFQTNRFSTKIAGHIRMSDVVVETHMLIDYSFNGGKKETVSIYLHLADQSSSKFLTRFEGKMQLESTAYPQINMETSLHYHHAQGRIECQVEMKTNPLSKNDDNKLIVGWLFSYLKNYKGVTKVKTSLKVRKKISDIDFKLGFSHADSIDATSTMVFLQYATGKEIKAILDFSLPYGKMFQFESKLRVMIPQAVVPLYIYTHIQEKRQDKKTAIDYAGEYDIEFMGTWFSGHNVTIQGVYLDHSTLSQTSHSVKLHIQSALFKDIHFISRFMMSETEYRLDFQAEHDDTKYGLLIRHSSLGIGIYETFGELLYSTSFYTFTNNIDILKRETSLELHLDKYRDIRIALKGFTNKTRLDAALDVKWDANRDPTQKLIINIITNSLGNLNYDGSFDLEYPGRVVTALGFTQHKDKNYVASAKVKWSRDDEIQVFVHAMHDIRSRGVAKFFAKVTTPFAKWERTSINYDLKLESQALNSYGSIDWLENQKVTVELSYYYKFEDNNMDLNFKGILNSSVVEINSMYAIFKHSHTDSLYSTQLLLQTNPNNSIALSSSGDITHLPDDSSKYHLAFNIDTPFSLIRQAHLSSELNIFPENKIKGSLHFLPNGKKYAVYLEGSLKHLNESRINVHIASPFEKYKQITGKYAFSASSKHFILEVKSPSASVGLELVYVYHNSSNFDLKLHVHSSLVYDSNLLIVGKINKDTVDLRTGWNQILVGLTGRSHYESWRDVDYSIQLFTPIEGYNRCSAIAKLVFGSKIDFEASVNFADKKIGLRIQAMEGEDDEFIVPLAATQTSGNSTGNNSLQWSEPEYGKVYWRGVMQLHSLLYPTVYAYSQLNEDNEEYYFMTFFNFPFGQLKITDDLLFTNYLNIENNILIESTCDCLKEIRSKYSLSGDLGSESNKISSHLEIYKTSGDSTVQGKVDLEYLYEPIDEMSILEGKYDVKFNVETPFQMLPFGRVHLRLLTERHSYATNLSIEVQNASVNLDGMLEFDETYFESNAGLQLATPFFTLPMSRITINKDFSDFEKKIEIGLAIPNSGGDGFVNYGVGGSWHHSDSRYMKYSGHIITPYASLGKIQGGFQMKNDEEEDFSLELFFRYSVASEIRMSSTLKGNELLLQADTTFEGFRDIYITTTILDHGHSKTLEATVTASKDYKLLCWITYAKGQPTNIEVKLYKSPMKGEIFSISANIVHHIGGYDVDAVLYYKDNQIHLDGKYIVWNDIGREISALVTSTYPGYESLNVSTVLLSRGNKLYVTKLISNVTSKLLTTNIELELNISMQDDGGIIVGSVVSPFFNGDSEIVWINRFLEQMILTIRGDCAFSNKTRDVSVNLFTWNVDKEFQEMSVGADVHYNNKDWWFCGNATLLAPRLDDITAMGHLLLPYKQDEMHRVSARLKYHNDFSYITHLIKYEAKPEAFSFHTASLIEMHPERGYGALLVQTRDYRFFDKFSGYKISDGYFVNNLLQSTNMQDDLLMKLLYRKPTDTHIINVDVFYPPETAIVKSYVEFIQINNMKARLNCTTPFPAFPHVQLLVNVLTQKTFYQRYGEVIWKNNSALFNYTHVSVIDDVNQKTDGSIVIDIPLVSRHVGHLKYNYESTEEAADGHSDLFYNQEYIMGGNYSRRTIISPEVRDQVINIKVNNSFMPAGITYTRKLINDSTKCCPGSRDFRRVEMFKLYDTTGFNVTGEYEVKQSIDDKMSIVRAFVGKRKFVMDTYYKGDTIFISTTNFTLKPNIWIGYEFSTIKRGINGTGITLNITYPRRHFTLNTDCVIANNNFHLQVVIHPNMLKQAKYFGTEFLWSRSPDSPMKFILLKVLHPSFNQNLTILGEYNRNKSAILDIDLQLIYSLDEKKKLMINSTLFKRLLYPGRNYEIKAYATHPATRLFFTGFSMVQFINGVFEMHKNISYKRSYAPIQFWSSDFALDFPKKLIDFKRNSVMDSEGMNAIYYKVLDDHLVNFTYTKMNGTKLSGNFFLNIEDCNTHLVMDVNPDSVEKLYMDGQVVDTRNVRFKIWRRYNVMSVKDVSFYVRLNTSRMLTSELFWRPEIPHDLMEVFQRYSNDAWEYVTTSTNYWTNYMKSEATDSIMDVWLDAKPIIQDFLDDIKNIRSLQDDIQYFKRIFNDAYAANEFYMQDIYNFYVLLAEEMSFKDKMNNFPKIISELWEIMGETGETIRQSILWAIETVQKIYKRIVTFTRELMSGETLNKITLYIQQVAGKYDKMIKDMHMSFLRYVESLWRETSRFMTLYWTRLINVIEPTFLQFTHHIESVFWEGSKKTLEFLFQTPEIMKSSVFGGNSTISKDLDTFYKDITKNDFLTNIRKYSKLFFDIVKEKYFSSVPFGYELNEIGTELLGEVKELNKLPIIKFTLETTVEFYNQLTWLFNYFNIGDKLQRAIPMLYNILVDASHTALENEMINHPGKTLFIFDIDNGLIKLEQKLPMPWHSFNETPNFEEIPEYRVITKVQKWFAPSNVTLWTYLYQFSPVLNPSLWLPPFNSHSIISGMRHFITFDKKHFDFRAPCTFLLSKDFVNNTFSLVLRYYQGKHHLVLLSGENTIIIDTSEKTLSFGRNGSVSFPVQLDDVAVIAEEGLVKVISDKGFELHCNFEYDVCTFTLSGWYYGKVAGLLGTMDNEPATDFLTSYGTVASNTTQFTKSWTLDNCLYFGVQHERPSNPKNAGSCNAIFHSKTSAFSTCYPLVDPTEYNNMCRKNPPGTKDEVCQSAFSYVKDCEGEHVPLHMPNFCVKCPYGNESKSVLPEGKFKRFSGKDIPMSSDIVFIVEAKKCNEYMRERRLVQTFVTILTKELSNVLLSQNRFSLITFGGDGIFNEPRKIFYNNKFFTSERYIPLYFENIPTGNGNTDIFSALRFASRIPFRPGVSKTFILVPCSPCDANNMTLEYTVLQQALSEKDIKLHILMNSDFDLEKLRVNKMFYGLDSEYAYTKSDFKSIHQGDAGLRSQIKLTKSVLGHCTPLAFSNNGTIFTGRKLVSESMAMVKKFCHVFARRIAMTAIPNECQNCECSSTEDGLPLMECFPCFLPIPIFTPDFEVRDNSTFFPFDTIDRIDIDSGF